MIKTITKLLALGFLSGFSFSANATEILTNGGFETGDFSGWSIVSNGGTSGCGTNLWTVNSTGAQGCTSNGTTTPAPVSGTYAAYNTFDGVGSAPFTLSQSIALPGSISSATLSFLDTYHMSYMGQDRIFQIDIFDNSNSFLITNLFTFTPGHSDNIGWTSHSLDIFSALASLAGETITIRFTNTVPQTYTGPAGFGIDDISLDVTSASVPAPTTLALMGLGLLGFGYRQKAYRQKPRTQK